jgi:hypothetical protein
MNLKTITIINIAFSPMWWAVNLLLSERTIGKQNSVMLIAGLMLLCFLMIGYGIYFLVQHQVRSKTYWLGFLLVALINLGNAVGVGLPIAAGLLYDEGYAMWGYLIGMWVGVYGMPAYLIGAALMCVGTKNYSMVYEKNSA